MALKRSTAIAITISIELAMLKIWRGFKKYADRRSWCFGFDLSMVAPQRTVWNRRKMSKAERAMRQ